MARNFELDSLKSREQEAFRRKQSAFEKYADARDRANIAHDAMQSAWEKRSSAREAMNREFEELQRSSDNYREVWSEYNRLRSENSARIDQLRYEADSEHQAMKDCFERASDAYEYGDKSEAPGYAAEGHEHKDRRNELNEEIGDLIQEIRDAKANAEWRAPKTDSSAFHRAKDIFEDAKARHESTQSEFKRLKADRNRKKADFNTAQSEYLRAKEAFQRKLAEVKTAKSTEKQSAVDKVNMALVRSNAHYLGTIFGQDAKIVPHADGTTHVFFGGAGMADGIGHGHAKIDQNGNVVYLRDAWQSHEDYLIDDARKRGSNTHKI